MKQKILKILRSKAFQPFWEMLHHISLVGMNHWGGASLYHSGEIHALKYMLDKLERKESIIVFDVGANFGQYALLINKYLKSGQIYSFEPSKYTYKILNKTVNKYPNIITHNIGFGSEKSSVKLYSSGKGDAIASVHKLNNRKDYINEGLTEEIELNTIDSFCNNNNIDFIDILKIDIEGHELYALKGALEMINNLRINFIQFEFSEFNIDSRTFFRDFYDLLSPYFILYRIVSNGIVSLSSYNEDLEIFHTANFIAERKNLLNTM